MKHLFTFSFLLLFFYAQGQVSVNEAKLNVFGNPFSDANQNYINMLGKLEEKGSSQLLFEDWTIMSVEGNDGTVMQIDSANYSIDVDKVYFMKDGKLYELYKHTVNQLTLGNQLFKNIVTRGKEFSAHYYEVLSDGEFLLLKKYLMKTSNSSHHPMGIKTPNSQKTVMDSKLFYYDTKRSKLEKLPKNKGKLISIFGRGNEALILYANKNNLSSKSERDLKKLFDYFNMNREEG